MQENSCRQRAAVAAFGLAAVLATATTTGRGVPGNDGQPGQLRPMRAVVDGFRLEAVGPGGRETVERLAEPVYIYDDPTRDFPLGAIWAWGRPGRPVALLTIAAGQQAGNEPTWLCELTSLATGPLSATVPGGPGWEPSDPGLVPRPLAGAAAPAPDEVKRLLQMKEIARRFKAHEIYQPRGKPAPERYELRLLPQPVLRYADQGSGLVDGALFLLAYGGNPEIVLVIEARGRGSSGPVWTYGFARTAAAELHVSLDGAEVWTQPKSTRTSNRDPYWAFVRLRQAD
jgi:hypothetical protein